MLDIYTKGIRLKFVLKKVNVFFILSYLFKLCAMNRPCNFRNRRKNPKMTSSGDATSVVIGLIAR